MNDENEKAIIKELVGINIGLSKLGVMIMVAAFLISTLIALAIILS